MFKNYLKTAWRSLKANKFYSIINICGLSVGLATGIMLLLWVQSELSYDKFHKDYRDIYRISSQFKANGKKVTWIDVPSPLAVYAQSIPQVTALVRISSEEDQILLKADKSKMIDGNNTAYVDSSFFSIFDFKLLSGNKLNLFPNNQSVLLTQSAAKKLFGNNKAMGKAILFHKTSFIVTGILKNFPENSSLQYDAIFPMTFFAQQTTENGGKPMDENFGDFNFEAYVELTPGADPSKTGSIFSSKFNKARPFNSKSSVRFQLQNLGSIHLITADGNDSAWRMVQIFMLVAILLLVIAAINYINLSTARSLIRAKEVSIRKIVGANKKQLFLQFITETFLLFCVSVALAIMLITLLMPLYNHISGKELHFSLANTQVLEMIGYAVLGTLLAASIYPALLLSSFQPLQSLKGKITSGTGTAIFRKILVVFQFVISIILIIGTLVIIHQMKYVKNKNLGFDKSYVFTVPLTNEIVHHIKAVKNELRNQRSIINVSTSNISDLSNFDHASDAISWPGKPKKESMFIHQATIDKDFIPTMKMQLLKGKNFSGTHADSLHYILNEAAVKAMGLKKPYVGQQITFHQRKGTIIGVVKDFNFQPLKEKISPFIFFTFWEGNILYVRTTAIKARQALAAVTKQYKKYAGDIPFSYTFIDKQFEAKYKSDIRAGRLFNLFAGIAIFISCLGLLGLATFTTQRRTKEIGVRKVLGASVGNILRLVSIDFLKLVAIAIIIAIPIAWLAMNKWLQNFAYRINMSWWIFVAAGVLAILIALVTVSWQAVRAARANPVDALRSE